MFCAKCGNELESGNKFCGKCGNPAPVVEQPAAPTVPQPPEETVQAPLPTQPTDQTVWIQPGQQVDAGPAAGEAQNAPMDEAYNAPVADPNAPAPTYSEAAPAYAVGQPDGGDKKKNKTPLIIGVVVVVVALAVAAIFALPKMRNNMDPTTYVFSSFGNTFNTMEAEWSDTAKTLNTVGLFDAYEDGRAHSRIGFELSGLDDLFDRAGVTFEAWTDYEGRNMEGTAGLALSGISLVELQYGLNDNTLWVELPALFEGTYGVDTETIGRDADSYFGGYGFYDDIGFNLFDIAAEARAAAGTEGDKGGALSAETEERLEALWQAFADGVDTTKMDKTTVSVNGLPQEVEEYYMLIPAQVVEAYLRGMGNALVADEYFVENMDTIFDFYTSYSYYSYTADEMIDEMVDTLVDLFKDGARANIYIKNDCVVRAELRFDPYGGNSPTFGDGIIQIEFGGADALIDAMTLTFGDEGTGNTDEELYIIEWKGQHKPVNGVFNSTLSFTHAYWGDEILLEASLQWDSQGDYNNLSFSFSTPSSGDVTLNGRGSLSIDGPNGVFDMSLNTVSFMDYWYDEYTFAFDYFVEPFTDHDFTSRTPVMLLSLSEAELEALYEEISYNAMLLVMMLAL